MMSLWVDTQFPKLSIIHRATVGRCWSKSVKGDEVPRNKMWQTNRLVCLWLFWQRALSIFNFGLGFVSNRNYKNEGAIVALVSTFRSVFSCFKRACMVAFVRHVFFGHRSSKDTRILRLNFHSRRPRIFYTCTCIFWILYLENVDVYEISTYGRSWVHTNTNSKH